MNTTKPDLITMRQENLPLDALEKNLEANIEARIASRLEPTGTKWQSIAITNCTSSAHTLADLIGEIDFGFYRQHSLIAGSGLSVDLFGGSTPDIVIHSLASKQNRIIIEVKKNSAFANKGRHGSQLLRYFFYLLATAEQKPKGKQDIYRAVLLAAPSSWFESNSREGAELWRQFLKDYGPIASTFHIALGEIRTDDLMAD
jgi:hypothetical protein